MEKQKNFDDLPDKEKSELWGAYWRKKRHIIWMYKVSDFAEYLMYHHNIKFKDIEV